MDIVDKILCPCLHQNSGWNWRGQKGKNKRLCFHICNNTMYFTFESLPDHNIVSSRKWSHLNCSCMWFFLLIPLASSFPAESDSASFLGHSCWLCESNVRDQWPWGKAGHWHHVNSLWPGSAHGVGWGSDPSPSSGPLEGQGQIVTAPAHTEGTSARLDLW